MLQPKRSKYRKTFRGKRRGISTRGATLAFGEFGLKATTRGWVSAGQLEAARKTITHGLKKGGRIWLRVFPDKPITARAAGHRMGGGKGEVSKYVVVITPGKIIFEVAGAQEEIVTRAFEKAAVRLPVRTRMIKKEG
ncbi:50S ribosomal protein L16 [Patescibacteria group bacterium]|nr:50S ribosomal protein L16 [Patescibacteria group bacterium]